MQEKSEVLYHHTGLRIYLTDGGLNLNSGQEDRIGPAHCVSCCNGNGCAWTGHYRDLETIDADEWPEFKEGDRVISYGSRQNSGWSFSWECCVYVAKQSVDGMAW
jgi:hypothetical protein